MATFGGEPLGANKLTSKNSRIICACIENRFSLIKTKRIFPSKLLYKFRRKNLNIYK